MSVLHELEVFSDIADRFAVPGGWIYRTWMRVPATTPGVWARVQMQAVFVPDHEMVAAMMVRGISSAATQAEAPASTAPSHVAATISRPGDWPKEYTKIACDVWIARWGHGAAPGDVIASNLRVLKKAGAPWDAVIRSFQRYVDTVEDQFASPAAWRKRWRAYDPDEPEFDAEAAKIADSYDRSARQRRGQGGLQHVSAALPRLPEGKR